MRTRMHALMLGSVLALSVVSASTPATPDTGDSDAYGDGYQAGNYGRIRYAENGASLVRTATDDQAGEAAEANSPIFPGDSLRTDRDQRVEVQLAGGTIVRVDRDADVVFQSLPDPYASFQDNAVLVLNGGALRVASQVKDKEEFRIDTGAASVYLLGEGEFRIEVDDRGRTRVASERGVAEVVGKDGSVLVRGGTQTSVDPGYVPADPVAYRAIAEDGFDRWCDARENAYRAPEVASRGGNYDPEEVPAEVRPYYGELSSYGTWAQVPDYGTVWYPSGVAAGWQPYAYGSWSYGPGGYFWVGDEPWGWAPYHYGCWQWVPRFGWCWIPGRVFAGAWVSWSWGSAFVGWAPLDFWGRPCWRGGPRLHGFYDPDCWTFVGFDHFGGRDLHRHAVPVARIGGDLDHATVVTRPPRVAPRELARSPESRGRALREAALDRAARVRPVVGDPVPGRRFIDVQNGLLRRGLAQRPDAPRPGDRGTSRFAPRASGPQPSSPAAGSERFPRRFAEDPRRPDRSAAPSGTARENVREFYDRMSRPRVTQEQPPSRRDAPAAGSHAQPPHPRYVAPEPREQPRPPRAQAPQQRYQEPQPRYVPPQPRYQPPQPRYQPPQPRYQQPAPRAQAPAPRPAPAPREQARPKQGKKN